MVVDALPLLDAEPPAGIGVVADDAKYLLGELAPALVVANVEAVAASVLEPERSPETGPTLPWAHAQIDSLR